ncbi:threonine/serine exporter family protein [Neptunitalea lumnitzerae]|uniref:Membrane protein n=1 Tax=Neptunitalea lumnitzerae TaxID=2965509 RepID=A0ABQ5MH25_9FLAO|nr:threonine/serine exporter family protein [Neptunitalea sp. Y10]GLB48720.1 membrane protein [Neptunitalea sp. Y10]
MNRNEPLQTGTLLLEIGALLMTSGANTNRVRVTIKRIAESYGYTADYLITHRAIMLTLSSEEQQEFNQIKQTYGFVPNFKVVSGISRLSWEIANEQVSLEEAAKEVERLKQLPHYSRWVILAVVGLACSSFCRLAGGSFFEMAIVFIASFTGLFCKQELGKRQVNAYVGVFMAAFVTTLVTGGVAKFFNYEHENIAFITAILYLIPGIPFINSTSDILDGNSLNGVVRAVNGFAISFAIASGLIFALLIYNLV